jgi:L-seryl-tRNA(Ser) seleniumtransferase
MVEAQPVFSRELVVQACREILDQARSILLEDGESAPSVDVLAARVVGRLVAITQPTLRPAINATGVIVHTNLGRAPLSEDARRAMEAVGQGYSNLEYDLDAGQRGSRYGHAVALLQR